MQPQIEEAELQALEASVFHRFGDRAMLAEALLHRSASIVSEGGSVNNQRLEFLGDRVLSVLVADLLYHADGANEGQLAVRQAALTSRAALVEVARGIALGDYLTLGGEDLRARDSTLEDACEAMIGALYLDGGLEAARRFVTHYWAPLIARQSSVKDAKSALQEWAQGQGLGLPVYEIAGQEGPAHAPEFTIRVTVGENVATGSGNVKKLAEQSAASALLAQVGAV